MPGWTRYDASVRAAKVLLRDNPDLPQGDRQAQLARLASVSGGLRAGAAARIAASHLSFVAQ